MYARYVHDTGNTFSCYTIETEDSQLKVATNVLEVCYVHVSICGILYVLSLHLSPPNNSKLLEAEQVLPCISSRNSFFILLFCIIKCTSLKYLY